MITQALVFIAVWCFTFAQFCPPGFVDMNGGTPCNNDVICASSDFQFQCIEGYCCKQIEPMCSNAWHQVEREHGLLKNCMYRMCSTGFKCEYNDAWGQYICCGLYNINRD
ncbi:hypothetical protein DICVIV_07937 [Dictyocaulus viviparus]|uniref:EB module n=1 Tax=Dictyocaulus viviparus TaxID=29172 RepID=A0A0D8XQA6_DICVI|nr:hypothetical protein DICVIV_07937 [Dictyocaulus viviparus]